MDKPKEILDLEKELGFELNPINNVAKILNSTSGKTYLLNKNNKIIGLNLDSCNIRDILFLEKTSTLVILSLRNNRVRISNISIVENLKRLLILDISRNQLPSIFFTKYLTNIVSLDVSNNNFISISYIKNLKKIKQLNLSNNKIKYISALTSLKELDILSIGSNEISDISVISDLQQITILDLHNNQISDISALTKCHKLVSLFLSKNQISNIEDIEKVISKNNNLNDLSLHGNPLPLPLEILKKKEALEISNYIKDLKKGKVGNQEAKVIFIGNGSVGKTQIARRLVGFDYQLTHKSTHAISILRQKVACNFVENGLWVSYWDFGGQDIYHTTHRLFMQTRAVIVLVWDSENEKSLTHSHNDKIYDNHNLEYWLSYAHYFSPNSPILVVQNKIDEKGTNYLPSETKQKYHEEYPQIAGFLEVSAEKKTNIDVLQEKITHTFENNLNIRAEIIKPIPKSWNNVLKATRFLEKSGYKKISKSFFTILCRLNNVRKSTDTILSYLHNIGALYHKEGYFSDKIILNQDWAIKAIYKILDRETQYFNLLNHAQENDKKISYSYLKEKVWTTNSDKECELFLDFMQSAELCYEATPKDTPLKNKEYVIPQLLPLLAKEDLESYAKARNLSHTEKINYRFLPPSLIQRFMITIQNEVTIISLWQKGLIIKQENNIVIIESIISKDRTLQYISLIYNEEAKNGFIEKIKDHFKILEGESPVKITKSEKGFDAIRYGREQMFGIQDRLENIENPQLNFTQMKNEKFIAYLSEATNTEIPDLLFVIKKQYEEMPSSKRGTFNQLKDEFENPPNNFQLNGWKARLKVFISGLDFEIDFEINYPNQTQTTKMEHLILKQIKGLEETYSILIDKKNFFEKELRKTNDTSARFSLTESLKEIKIDMNNLLQEIDDLSQQTTKSSSNSSSVSGNGNVVIQGSNNSQINIEINNLKQKTKQADQEIEESLKDNLKSVSLLYIAAQPADKGSLRSEFDDIAKKLYNSVKNKEVEIFLPSWETDYNALLTHLKNHKPTILHYSGHGNKNGLALMNKTTGLTQELENDELEEIFENRNEYLKLVFLNSCFSSYQAEIISSFGMYVLGINDREVADELAIKLAESFYLGLSAQDAPINVEKAIKMGCRNFVKSYNQENYISLWKNGKEISYKSL